LGGRASRVAVQAGRQLEMATLSVQRHSARLGPRAVSVVDREAERMVTWRRLLAAYDVERQLERGYTLTIDAAGRIVRSTSGLSPGDTLVTRFADGTARSVVESAQHRPPGREESA
ncbi:MAG: exodeoxyribonuclease VII large subunit, partial [Acidimicrobiales bacterium]